MSCVNHAGKRGSFWAVENGERRAVCGRCALAYTRSNVECIEMDGEEEEAERRAGLVDFSARLRAEQLRCGQLTDALLAASERFLASELAGLAQISAHYEGLMQRLAGLRDAHLATTRAQNEKTRLVFAEALCEAKNRATEFANIAADVEENTEKIIQKIEMDAFRLILGRYEEKLADFQRFCSEVAGAKIVAPPFAPLQPPELEAALGAAARLVPSVLPLVKPPEKTKGSEKEQPVFELISEEGPDYRQTPELGTKGEPSVLHLKLETLRADDEQHQFKKPLCF